MLADTRTMLAWCCRVRFLVMAGAQCLLSSNLPYKRVCWRFHTTASSTSTSVSFASVSLHRCTFVSVEDEYRIFLFLVTPSFLINSRLSARPIRYPMWRTILIFFKWYCRNDAKWVQETRREGAIGKLYLIVIALMILSLEYCRKVA